MVVAPDVRLRFERKFKVKISTRESWDKVSQYGMVQGGSVPTRHEQESIFFAGGWTTIFQAEFFAILEVATSKEVTEGQEGVIEIYSESQASARMGNRLIQECWDALNNVAERKQVKLVWIMAHMGFAENERTDALARFGSSESPITAEPHIGLSNRQVASALSDA